MASLPIYDVHLFSDFFKTVDEVVDEVSGVAWVGVSEYIVPIAWVALGILALVWASAIWHGHGSMVKDWVTKMAKFVLILQFASAFYLSWVVAPLISIPNELTYAIARFQTAVNGGGHTLTGTTAADQLAGALEQLVLGTLQATVDAFKDWNIGGALALFSGCILMIVAGVVLLVIVIFNLLYAKIGMAYILSIGPLFIFFLAIPATRSWFTAWLNTAFYFVMLSVMSTLTMLLFTGIADKFMTKLTKAITDSFHAQIGLAEALYSMLGSAMTGHAAEGVANAGNAAGNMASAQINVVSIALQMVLVFIPMALVALETRTMVASLTGGSGGSFGTGVANVVSTAWRGGVARPGGTGGGSGGGTGGTGGTGSGATGGSGGGSNSTP